MEYQKIIYLLVCWALHQISHLHLGQKNGCKESHDARGT